MANQLVPFEVPAGLLAELSGMFGPDQSNKDLTEGVQPSFAVVTFRGKVWRVRHKGEDRIIKHPETGEPVQSIIGVIVKASPAVSKLYYSKAYTEGDDAPPLCFSLNGEKPDDGSAEKQSPTCAACPHNAWGSRITESGGKAKACSDNRRLAIVPYPDIDNVTFGGPMLLRVPPTSLQELARLGDSLKQTGLPYQAIVVKISFDYELAYPKLIFTAVRALSTEEAKKVFDHMQSDAVTRMLMEPVTGDETGADGSAAPETPVQAAPKKEAPAPTSKKKAAPAPAPAPQQEPEEEEEGDGDEEPAPPAEEKPAARKTPAKQATAEADTVSEDLNAMVKNLLNA